MAQPDASFDVFVELNAAMLFRLSYALCGDRGRAEDATQEALARVYVRWDQLGNPLSYARRCAVSATRDGWRRVGRREQPLLLSDGLEPSTPPSTIVEDRDQLLRALRGLPHGQRAAVVLRYWHDLSEAETAETLGISTGTVKSQTSKALRNLRAHLHQPLEGAVR
jgi:RNA polymerase sigma-70 factor (sigma-E family)